MFKITKEEDLVRFGFVRDENLDLITASTHDKAFRVAENSLVYVLAEVEHHRLFMAGHVNCHRTDTILIDDWTLPEYKACSVFNKWTKHCTEEVMQEYRDACFAYEAACKAKYGLS